MMLLRCSAASASLAIVLLGSAAVVPGCVGEETVTFGLGAVDDSGVTGTATINQSAGKAGLGELRWGFVAEDAQARTLAGAVRGGRCDALGDPVHSSTIAPGEGTSQLDIIGAESPSDAEPQTIDGYAGDHAFAIHDTDFDGVVLACGNVDR